MDTGCESDSLMAGCEDLEDHQKSVRPVCDVTDREPQPARHVCKGGEVQPTIPQSVRSQQFFQDT